MIKTFHGWMNILKETYWTEKSHICEEDGPHLRISFWHLSDEPWKNWKWQKIAGDIFILHMCTKNHNHMRCSSWDMEWGNFLVILSHFLPFILENLKPKNPRDIIILHKCTINDNHMIHGSWDINCNKFFLSSFFFFLPFHPPDSPKNENIKKMKKKPGDITILHKCTKNHDHMLTHVIFAFHFGLFFALLIPP